MIVGIFLRNIKTYQGINYIPITDQDRFCGLLGENGIGKSSILEALDCFFNDRVWNYNTVTKRSGFPATKPQIVPVFLIPKLHLQDPVSVSNALILSNVANTIAEENVNPGLRVHIKRFIEHRAQIEKSVDMNDYYLLPVGTDYQGNTTVSIFNSKLLVDHVVESNDDERPTTLTDEELKQFDSLRNELKTSIEYIYIPRDIDPEHFTRLETKEIQVLMGETLNEIISQRVTPGQISEINRSLNDFLDTLAAELDIYSYRTPTDRQQQLKKGDVYNLIVQAFFNIRKLHKKQGDNHWLEISSLSSGEKQKAIIDVAHSLLSRHRGNGENLIIGIDEPESSLHMSSCFDQFDSLYEISRDCMQLIFSSHWYGFLPTIESGSATIISRNDDSHVFDMINLSSYREQIKQIKEVSKGKLPYDIRLKSINDFIQSVVVSTMGENPFSWIICEGSSEKIYFSEYFKDLIEQKRLRIVPVGGASEIKRIYSHLATSYEDFKKEIKGVIVLISDTDSQLVRYDTASHEKLICKRIVNCNQSKSTKLVSIQSSHVSPETEIEDALSANLYFRTLCSFKNEYPELLSFLDSITIDEKFPSYFAMDLRQTEREKIKAFFDMDNNKYKFSKKYSESIFLEIDTPSWIEEIRRWLTS